MSSFCKVIDKHPRRSTSSTNWPETPSFRILLPHFLLALLNSSQNITRNFLLLLHIPHTNYPIRLQSFSAPQQKNSARRRLGVQKKKLSSFLDAIITPLPINLPFRYNWLQNENNQNGKTIRGERITERMICVWWNVRSMEDYSVPSTTDFYNNIVSTRNGIFNIPMGYCLSNYCCINTIIKPFSFAAPPPPALSSSVPDH